MAFIDTDMDNPEGFATFYNLTKAVGNGCTNLKEDVMVVQFFLNRYYLKDKRDSPISKNPLKVDGLYGPKTRARIIQFQNDAKNAGSSVIVDGVVNKAGNARSNWESSISRTNYVIRLLNNTLRRNDSFVYNSLPYNQEVPPELRLAFLQMHAEGPAMHDSVINNAAAA